MGDVPAVSGRGWRPFRYLTEDDLTLIVDDDVMILDDLPRRPVGAAYTAAAANRAALSWSDHQLLLGRAHEDARRVKSAYRRRNR
ncbi:hypothetical protein [Streptosporangium longisporum]|uniref:Uncharacterized protein n=1 Tax=Streptosporangium longisporum TaxID=46187 RepID=A0ABP6L204_9ACTN